MISGRRFCPSSLRHFFGADIISLKAMASPVLRLRHPLVRFVRCRTVAKVLSIGFDVRMPKPSRYRGFAALDTHGHLLWGTIKRSEIEAQEAHDRFNPDATGEGMGERVVSIEIRLTK